MVWYNKSADQGLATAQYTMAVSYALGRGVAKDDVSAADWYRKAAEQGFAEAQFRLGMMYDTGQGVNQDKVLAFLLYTLSIPAAKDAAKDLMINLRGKIVLTMTPEELAEGFTLASHWTPGMPFQRSQQPLGK